VPCEVEEENFECDYETLGKLTALEAEKEQENNKEEENPIWEKLNKIKFNKN
jgi:hypothetical protein